MAGSSLHRLSLQGAATAAGTRIGPEPLAKNIEASTAYRQNADL
jgi:hypothetical protein